MIVYLVDTNSENSAVSGTQERVIKLFCFYIVDKNIWRSFALGRTGSRTHFRAGTTLPSDLINFTFKIIQHRPFKVVLCSQIEKVLFQLYHLLFLFLSGLLLFFEVWPILIQWV